MVLEVVLNETPNNLKVKKQKQTTNLEVSAKYLANSKRLLTNKKCRKSHFARKQGYKT